MHRHTKKIPKSKIRDFFVYVYAIFLPVGKGMSPQIYKDRMYVRKSIDNWIRQYYNPVVDKIEHVFEKVRRITQDQRLFHGNVCNSLMIRINVISGKIAKEIKEEKFKLKEEK